MPTSDSFAVCFKEGALHREQGSAWISSSGDSFWYKDNMLHREDGPAIVSGLEKSSFGESKHSFWLENKQFTKEQYDLEIARRQGKIITDQLSGKIVEFDGVKYQLNRVDP